MEKNLLPPMDDLDFTEILRAQDSPPEPASALAEPIPEDILIGAQALATGNYCVNMMRARRTERAEPENTTIIIVEDDPSTLELLEALLTRAGYQTRTARDSATFVETLKQLPLPDLVILDVELPGNVSGFAILAKIREHPVIRDLPVIIFTAHTEPQDLLRGVNLGADAYLSKPARGQALMEVVRSTLGG